MTHDPLLKQADSLLPAAALCATTLNEIIADHFPNIHPAAPTHWNFVVTIAAAFVANTQLLSLQMEKARKRRLMARVIEQCTEWNSDAPLGFEHCKSFFERTCEALSGGEHESR